MWLCGDYFGSFGIGGWLIVVLVASVVSVIIRASNRKESCCYWDRIGMVVILGGN